MYTWALLLFIVRYGVMVFSMIRFFFEVTGTVIFAMATCFFKMLLHRLYVLWHTRGTTDALCLFYKDVICLR